MKLSQPKPSFLKKTNKTQVDLGFKKAFFDLPDAPIVDFFYGLGAFSMFGDARHSYHDYDLYLSGAMTGKEGFGYAEFNTYATRLRSKGFRVFNPAENFGGDSTKDRDEYMRKDVQAVTRCSNILVLPDSNHSRGVTTELNVALGLDMGIYMMCKSDEARLPLIVQLR